MLKSVSITIFDVLRPSASFDPLGRLNSSSRQSSVVSRRFQWLENSLASKVPRKLFQVRLTTVDICFALLDKDLQRRWKPLIMHQYLRIHFAVLP